MDEVGQRHLCRGDEPPAIGGLVAVLTKLGELAGAEHHFRADEDGGDRLGQAVVLDMGVEHELGQRAVDAGRGLGQDDEAGARQFGGGVEVHAAFHRRDVVMFAGSEGEVARGAPAADFDVPGLIRAVGDVGVGQVGDGQEQVGQLLVEGLGLVPQPRDFGFLFSDFGAEAFECRVIAAGLGGADLFRRAVLVGLGGFRREDAGAAFFVQRQDGGGLGGEATAGEGRVEGGGVVADGADVVHGGLPDWWGGYAGFGGRGEGRG